ncbi:MAG: hypothetical protein WBD36_04770 [Bacteroidota bacterium]
MDRLIEMASNPDFISGIYNYCDRWCERCLFTRRCLLYATEQENLPRKEGHDPENKELWEHVDSMLKLALQMLKEGEIEQIPISPQDLADHDLRRRETERHPLAQDAKSYSHMVSLWFDDHKHLFETRERQTGSDIGTSDQRMSQAWKVSAAEVIRWYQHQTRVKIMRALSGGEEHAPEELDEFPRDSDGSAKVALVGIDRSIGAWEALRNEFPIDTEGILDVIIYLNRLRMSVEERFPNARVFVRPGFDQEMNNIPDNLRMENKRSGLPGESP